MRKSGLTFEELRDLLLEVGFSQGPQEQGRLRFDDRVTGTILLFRAYRSNEMVNQRDMAVVRRQLVDNGLIEGAAFDRFLERASA